MDEIDNSYRFQACRMISISSCKQCGKRCKLYKNAMSDLCRKINPLKKDGLNWPAQNFKEKTIFPDTWPPVPDEYSRLVERSKSVHSREYWRMELGLGKPLTKAQRDKAIKAKFAKSSYAGVIPEVALESFKPEPTTTSNHIAYEDSKEPDTCKSIAEGESLQYSAQVGKIHLEQHGFVKVKSLVGFKTYTGVRFERCIERIWFLQNGHFRLAEIEVVNRVNMTEEVPQYQTIYHPNYRPVQEGPADTTMFTSTWMTRKDRQDKIDRGQVALQVRRKDADKLRLDELEHRIKTSTGVFRC